MANRMKASPLVMLHSRCSLGRGDTVLNDALANAALKYRDAWLRAQGTVATGFPQNTYVQSQHRERLPAAVAHGDEFKIANAALDEIPEFKIVVDRIVLHEHPLVDVGHDVSGYRAPKSAEAIAVDRLCCGLRRLAVHFGLIALRDGSQHRLVAKPLPSAA